MNVLFVIRRLGVGGAERQLAELARGMAAEGHDVHVAVFYDDGEIQREVAASGVPVTWLGKRRRWDVVSQFVSLRRLHRTLEPDAVHGYMTGANLAVAAACRAGRSRLAWGVRNSALESQDLDRLERVLAWLEPRLARFVDVVVVNSEQAARDFAAGAAGRVTITVIPNGVDAERFAPDPVARAEVRADLGVDDCVNLVGRIGRVDPMKDYETFLAAADRLAARRDDVEFLCAGDGPPAYVAELRRRAAQGPRVHWLPATAAVERLYNACDVCVSSSRYGEAFPNVVAEAMACGVPCVVTDVGDSAAVVGGEGEVVAPGDPAALADAVDRLLKATDLAPRERIVARYGLDCLVARTTEVLSG